MVTKYNEIIKIRRGKASYNITEEQSGEWTSFIPNEQFNEVLNAVLKSIRADNIDNHKSFWINGTYGTGKSHAASVISHLLGDEVADIKKWVDYEYSDARFDVLRSNMYAIRKKSRLLPVKLYGLNSMTNKEDLSVVVQNRVSKTLKGYGIDISVPTDFETSIAHINKNPEIWDLLIKRNIKLSTVVSDRKQLIQKLQTGDLGIYHRVKESVVEAGFAALRFENDKIGQWLMEVQNNLRKQGKYSGLLIIWDEFTDVMNDAIGFPVLTILQEVAETFMNLQNDSYLFLISHPSAYDKLDTEQRQHTDGRYHCKKYNMEPISAFKIMSRKFEIINGSLHNELCQGFYRNNNKLMDIFIQGSNDQLATKADLYKLYPLHPGTANLATYYATTVGSSSRSVFEFLGQNDTIEKFLDNEDFFKNKDTITADYLWDYVLKVFQENVLQYGPITERYNSYLTQVTNAGDANLAIFKGVLLLNAFNNIAGAGETNKGLVTPSEANIYNLFCGSRYAENVNDVLRWFNEEGIIQRSPGTEGLYSVRFSALPSNEIEEKITEMRDVQYKCTHKILEFAIDAAKNKVNQILKQVIRPYEYAIYSDVGNENVLRSQVKNKRKSIPDYSLFFAFLVSRNNTELDKMRTFAEKCVADDDKDFKNIIFIVFDEVLGNSNYEDFIGFQANIECASAHGFMAQAEAHKKDAIAVVQNWLDLISRNNARLYIMGKPRHVLSMKLLSDMINSAVIPYIYYYAPEASELLRTNAKNTFWAIQNSKEIVRILLSIISMDELSKLNNQMKPIQFLFQDCLESSLELKPNTQDHPLRRISEEVNEIIKSASGMDSIFNFEEKFVALTKPPYGLYKSYASMGAMAFALKPWINKIFDPQGKPLDINALTDSLSTLFDVWWDPKKSKKNLIFKFQTPEESELCKELIYLFNLKGQNQLEINSLTATRFVIVSEFLAKRNAPLWAIKYAPKFISYGSVEIEITDKIKHLIDNIVLICVDGESRNQKLFKETIQLISASRLEIKNILGEESAFAAGFNRYLQQIEGADVKENDIDEVRRYIEEHLESTVGYWTEEEVEKQVLHWMIEKGQNSSPSIHEDELHDPVMPNNLSHPDSDNVNLQGKRIKATERVNSMTDLEEAKNILKTLCECADEQAIDIIIG